MRNLMDWRARSLQFPMTAVLTTAVNNFNWFSAVLFMNKAVVYLSQNEAF